jgi:predicted PurR-regulated permease PerM
MTNEAGNASPIGAPRGHLVVTVTPKSAAIAGASLLAVFGAWNALVSGRSIIATAIAAAVVGVLVSGPVEALDRYIPRGFSILVTLLLLGGAAGGIGYVAYDDLDTAFARLQREAPAAAAELESSDRFGEIATDLRLEQRVTDAVDRLRTNTKDRAQRTALRFVNYFLGTILSIFLLVYGPRMFAGGLRLVESEDRRLRIARVAYRAVDEARRYLALEIVNATVIGAAAFICFSALDLPGAAALALVVALGSAIPDLGILAAAVPALLLTAASKPYSTFLILVALAIAVQVVDSLFSHRRLVKSIDVGPAVSLLAVLLGFAIYGIGGGLFGFAVAVFVSAVIDALGDERAGLLPDPPAILPGLPVGASADEALDVGLDEINRPDD